MSLIDGAHRCDGCGRPIGAGGLDQAAIVSVLLSGAHVNLHLCLTQSADRAGCAPVALDPAMGDYLLRTGQTALPLPASSGAPT